jgi:hypothetical protein
VEVSVTKADRASAQPAPGSDPLPEAVFVPTPEDIVERMLAMAELTAQDHLYALGSGDGRVVVAAARSCGSKAVGYEIDGQLVEQSRERIREHGVEALATIHHADLFTADLGDVDVVAVYLPPDMLARLLPQFEKLKPGARIISHQFCLPGFAPDRLATFVSNEDGEPHRLYLWITPLKKGEPPQPYGRRGTAEPQRAP